MNRWTAMATALLATLLSALLPGCDTAEAPGYGTVHLALTGSFPGVQAMRVRIYEGAVTNIAAPAKFVLADCQPYLVDGEPRNKITVRDLRLDKEYALVVDLYGDAACSQLAYRAYRGRMKVLAGSAAEASAQPYYVQPYRVGGFVGLARINQVLLDSAAKKSCSSDVDCRSIHVNAQCAKGNKCTVDHLFPLNGGARRGFPSVVGLPDGRVAVAGGLTTSIEGVWTATSDRAEVFDPGTGLFSSEGVANAGLPVGLAQNTTLTNAAFALAAGTTEARVSLEKGTSLTTALETQGCHVPGTACAVSDVLARWDLQTGTAQQADLGEPRIFPIVAGVRTADGDRVLVAGGATVPLPPGAGDSRSGSSMLCRMDATGVDCQPGPTMQAGRAHAAVACVEPVPGGCGKVLVLGGRKAGSPPLAELFDGASETFTPVEATGAAPKIVHGGTLLPLADGSFLLLGGSEKAPFLEDGKLTGGGLIAPLRLTLDLDAAKPTIAFSPVDLGNLAGADAGKRLFPTAVGLGDRSVLLIGGVDEKLQPLADALLFGPDGQAKARLALDVNRFGAAAARIGGKGAIGGCVLLAGGFTWQSGALVAQNHVEVFCPDGL